MNTSFYTAISGVKSFQNGIDVWGDNIANINTTAYKASIPEFETIFAKNISSHPISSDVGIGSILHSTAKDLSIGSLVHSDKTFDLALSGEGWFKVKKGEEFFYTRDGRFNRDRDGFLVNDEGAYLIVANANNLISTNNGYIINANINTDDLINTGTFSPISLPENVILPAVATKNIKISANLSNDDVLQTPFVADSDLYFSALYDKDGNFLHMVDGNSIAYNVGENISYKNNLFEKEICIEDDLKDGKDVVFDFFVNDKHINLSLPDGSSKETIIKALSEALNNNNILHDITNNGIVIKEQNKLIIKSNNDLVKDAAGYLLVYKNNPLNENEFNTMQSLATKLQNILNEIYPNVAQVNIENGKIVINNNSIDTTIISKFDRGENNNEAFYQNILSVGNTILPSTAAKSYEFMANKKSFGGYIYEANGEKDTLSFEFLKKEVVNDNTIWKGKISVIKNDEVISENNFDFIFNNEGFLISPNSVSINTPQPITIETNLSSFRSIDEEISYSFSQDGVEEGFLKAYEINENGDIFANFSNDRSIKVATIPVFHFVNDQGLESVGASLFRETSNSNKAFLYKDQSGNYISGSKILSHMLEASNVKMTQAMTELIVTQKAFSSAAKAVTTSDEMVQRAINLKRG